jgi:hypothetical protein
MGWTFSRQSRAELIRRLVRSKETEDASIVVVAHTLRGTVLWSVVEVTAKRSGVFEGLSPGQTGRYILCDLLVRACDEWGHKPLDESMHPFYYSCPLRYLDMAPVRCADWRQRVRAFHEQRRKRVKPT